MTSDKYAAIHLQGAKKIVRLFPLRVSQNFLRVSKIKSLSFHEENAQILVTQLFKICPTCISLLFFREALRYICVRLERKLTGYRELHL